MQDDTATMEIKCGLSGRRPANSQGRGVVHMSLISFDVDSIELNKDLSLSFLRSVQRPGVENLIRYLYNSDYFTAPASTRFHNSFPGGLCLHSLNLVHAFNDANKQLLNPLPLDSVVICGLLHDLCKVNAYLRQIRVTSPQRTSKVMLPCHSQG